MITKSIKEAEKEHGTKFHPSFPNPDELV